MNQSSHIFRRSAFVLFEVMLAVSIFAIGIIALGRCVEQTISADTLKQDDVRARQALENAIALIDAGAVMVPESSTEELKGMFVGMKLKTSKVPFREKNEDGVEIAGIFTVTVEVLWVHRGEPQSRDISFFHSPR